MKMKVLIYIKPGCDYCMDAMDWFAARGIEYALVNATTPLEQNQIKARLTREHKINITTFPQIFVDGEYIGGQQDLMKKQSHILSKFKEEDASPHIFKNGLRLLPEG